MSDAGPATKIHARVFSAPQVLPDTLESGAERGCLRELTMALAALTSRKTTEAAGRYSFLALSPEWPAAWQVRAHAAHQALAVGCRDDLDLVLRIFSDAESAEDLSAWCATWWVDEEALAAVTAEAAELMTFVETEVDADRLLDPMLAEGVRRILATSTQHIRYEPADAALYGADPGETGIVVGFRIAPTSVVDPGHALMAFGVAVRPSGNLIDRVVAFPGAPDRTVNHLTRVRSELPVGTIVEVGFADPDGGAHRIDAITVNDGPFTRTGERIALGAPKTSRQLVRSGELVAVATPVLVAAGGPALVTGYSALDGRIALTLAPGAADGVVPATLTSGDRVSGRLGDVVSTPTAELREIVTGLEQVFYVPGPAGIASNDDNFSLRLTAGTPVEAVVVPEDSAGGVRLSLRPWARARLSEASGGATEWFPASVDKTPDDEENVRVSLLGEDSETGLRFEFTADATLVEDLGEAAATDRLEARLRTPTPRDWMLPPEAASICPTHPDVFVEGEDGFALAGPMTLEVVSDLLDLDDSDEWMILVWRWYDESYLLTPVDLRPAGGDSAEDEIEPAPPATIESEEQYTLAAKLPPGAVERVAAGRVPPWTESGTTVLVEDDTITLVAPSGPVARQLIEDIRRRMLPAKGKIALTGDDEDAAARIGEAAAAANAIVTSEGDALLVEAETVTSLRELFAAMTTEVPEAACTVTGFTDLQMVEAIAGAEALAATLTAMSDTSPGAPEASDVELAEPVAPATIDLTTPHGRIGGPDPTLRTQPTIHLTTPHGRIGGPDPTLRTQPPALAGLAGDSEAFVAHIRSLAAFAFPAAELPLPSNGNGNGHHSDHSVEPEAVDSALFAEAPELLAHDLATHAADESIAADSEPPPSTEDGTEPPDGEFDGVIPWFGAVEPTIKRMPGTPRSTAWDSPVPGDTRAPVRSDENPAAAATTTEELPSRVEPALASGAAASTDVAPPPAEPAPSATEASTDVPPPSAEAAPSATAASTEVAPPPVEAAPSATAASTDVPPSVEAAPSVTAASADVPPPSVEAPLSGAAASTEVVEPTYKPGSLSARLAAAAKERAEAPPPKQAAIPPPSPEPIDPGTAVLEDRRQVTPSNTEEQTEDQGASTEPAATSEEPTLSPSREQVMRRLQDWWSSPDDTTDMPSPATESPLTTPAPVDDLADADHPVLTSSSTGDADLDHAPPTQPEVDWASLPPPPPTTDLPPRAFRRRPPRTEEPVDDVGGEDMGAVPEPTDRDAPTSDLRKLATRVLIGTGAALGLGAVALGIAMFLPTEAAPKVAEVPTEAVVVAEQPTISPFAALTDTIAAPVTSCSQAVMATWDSEATAQDGADRLAAVGLPGVALASELVPGWSPGRYVAAVLATSPEVAAEAIERARFASFNGTVIEATTDGCATGPVAASIAELGFVDVPLTDPDSGGIAFVASSSLIDGCNPPDLDLFCAEDLATTSDLDQVAALIGAEIAPEAATTATGSDLSELAGAAGLPSPTVGPNDTFSRRDLAAYLWSAHQSFGG